MSGRTRGHQHDQDSKPCGNVTCSRLVGKSGIQCSACHQWFHFECVGLKPRGRNGGWSCAACTVSALNEEPSAPAQTPSAADPSEHLLSQLVTICQARSAKIVKRIPKACRNQVANRLTELLTNVVRDPEDIKGWTLLFCFARFCLKVDARGGRNRTHVSFAEKATQYCLADILAFKQAPGKSRKSKNVDIAELVQGKIEEFDVKGAVRIISSNDKLAEQTPEVIQEMRAKHPSGDAPCTLPSEAEPARSNPNSVRKKICSFRRP